MSIDGFSGIERPRASQRERDDAMWFWCEADAAYQGLVKVLNGEVEEYPLHSRTAKEEFNYQPGFGLPTITRENVHEFIPCIVDIYPVFHLAQYYAEQLKDPTPLTDAISDTIPVIKLTAD